MIRVLLTFCALFCAFHVCIQAVRVMTGRELWSFTKLTVYAATCAALTVFVMLTIVVLF